MVVSNSNHIKNLPMSFGQDIVYLMDLLKMDSKQTPYDIWLSCLLNDS